MGTAEMGTVPFFVPKKGTVPISPISAYAGL